MDYANRDRSFYERPAAAKQYRSVESMAGEPNVQKYEKVVVNVPAAGTMRPLSYNIFDEPTNLHQPKADVICSGNVVLIGQGDGDNAGAGYHIGIIPTDCVEGDRVAAYVTGKWWLPLDWEGDAGTSRAASNMPSTLVPGSQAYYIVGEGLVTDKIPPAGTDYLRIGSFIDTMSNPKPELPWGLAHALVDVVPMYQTTVNLPAVAAISFAADYAVFPNVSTADGLEIDLFVNPQTSDPNAQIDASDVTVTMDTGGAAGAADVFNQEVVNYTFASAGTYDITIAIGTRTFNFQVTVAAGAAPSIVKV